MYKQLVKEINEIKIVLLLVTMYKGFIIKFIIILISILNLCLADTNLIPVYITQKVGHNHPGAAYPLLDFDNLNKHSCFVHNKVVKCLLKKVKKQKPLKSSVLGETISRRSNPIVSEITRRSNPIVSEITRRSNPIVTEIKRRSNPIVTKKATTMSVTRMHTNMYPMPMSYINPNRAPVHNLQLLNNNPYNVHKIQTQTTNSFKPLFNSVTSYTHKVILKPPTSVHVFTKDPRYPYQSRPCFDKFRRSLDEFERKFYMVTFDKLTSISPQDRRVNGMSFVQSGFFLQLTLMALSLEVDSQTRAEIDNTIKFRVEDTETKGLIRELISSLPLDSDNIKFRRASRLVLMPECEVSHHFRTGVATALRMAIDSFNGTEKADQMCSILNRKIEKDSGGAIRDTFDEEDLSGRVVAVLMTTLYYRARWRVPPTVLNDTMPFRDADDAPNRTVRMIKVNDIMGYADLNEWDAQALEINYASPELSLLIIVPRTSSLRKLAGYVTNTSINDVTSKMRRKRIAVTLPLYTLRMTLLLPNKLQPMGISKLVDVSNFKKGDPLRLSHMVQRVMFWAEAGRNAYKDDGLEWDPTPEMDILIDRPYIFFVRCRNITIMNGNFVL